MRNQNQDLKNKRLTWVVIILLVIIAILLGYLAISSFYSKNDTYSSSLAESTESSTTTVSSTTSVSSTESTQSSDLYPYSIKSVSDTRFKGYFPNSTLEIRIGLNRELNDAGIIYGEFQSKPKGLKPLRLSEIFKIEQLPTKEILVRVGQNIKTVRVNTYLRANPDPEESPQVAENFFLQFNDQDLRDMYLFYTKQGNLALAYQLDPTYYAQINFAPLSESE